MLLLRLGNLWLGNAMTTHCVLGDNDELTTEAAALEKPGHDFRVYEGVYEDNVDVDVSVDGDVNINIGGEVTTSTSTLTSTSTPMFLA